MDTLPFLRAVWPDEGLYCIAVPFPKKGYDHHVFETIGAAAKYVETVRDTSNVFFGTHTLRDPRVWDPHHHKENREWVGGWRVRTQDNSRSSRIFFFDLDVGADDETKYATQPEAVVGLQHFIAATHLPIPMVVSSGGGLHTYWVVDREIDSANWVPIASKLKQLAHYYNLRIDNARTTDTASVLRVAGTFNLKTNVKRPVEVAKETTPIGVEEFTKLVNAAIDEADISVKAIRGRPAGPSAIAAKLGSNTANEFKGPPPTMSSLIRACAQIERIEIGRAHV